MQRKPGPGVEGLAPSQVTVFERCGVPSGRGCDMGDLACLEANVVQYRRSPATAAFEGVRKSWRVKMGFESLKARLSSFPTVL